MENKKPKLGITIMPNSKFLEAALPLFKEELIEIIEWSFDTVKDATLQPAWLPLMLKEYGEKNRLLGHGVYYSLLDAKWSTKQDRWLKKVKQDNLLYSFLTVDRYVLGTISNKFQLHNASMA